VNLRTSPAQQISCTDLRLRRQYNTFSLAFSWFALANLWLTFSIIIDLLPDSSQGTPFYFFGTAEVTHWVNLAFKWLYLGSLALQFVLALGNRPKGERGLYVTTFV
jgi:chitin synthase